ncbi:hypothetical protein [Microbispora sp. CA-102843]|uniref:hypothetical protein n=1 Tax=Microbispora sp. CA-102843 TaxID=3239952 RepID=UPI003D936117
MSDRDKRAVLAWRATILTGLTILNVFLIIENTALWTEHRFAIVVVALGAVVHWIAAMRTKEDPDEAAERIYQETRVQRPLSPSDVRDEVRLRYRM